MSDKLDGMMQRLEVHLRTLAGEPRDWHDGPDATMFSAHATVDGSIYLEEWPMPPALHVVSNDILEAMQGWPRALMVPQFRGHLVQAMPMGFFAWAFRAECWLVETDNPYEFDEGYRHGDIAKRVDRVEARQFTAADSAGRLVVAELRRKSGEVVTSLIRPGEPMYARIADGKGARFLRQSSRVTEYILREARNAGNR